MKLMIIQTKTAIKKTNTIEEDLRKWTFMYCMIILYNYNIILHFLIALGYLLDRFCKFVKDLSNDRRIDMGTPKQYQVSKNCDGDYYHFRIIEVVQKQI